VRWVGRRARDKDGYQFGWFIFGVRGSTVMAWQLFPTFQAMIDAINGKDYPDDI